MYVWLYLCLGCTRVYVCRCNDDVIYVGHDLNRCSGWWYVCSVVLVKGLHLVERQILIDVGRMCDLYMLCRLCVP